jgi:hypothetical protein
MIKILCEFMIFHNYHFSVIDSTVRGALRRQAMDSFNSPDGSCFVLVIRTQSGNTGIDLRSADAVIIYDSDEVDARRRSGGRHSLRNYTRPRLSAADGQPRRPTPLRPQPVAARAENRGGRDYS